MDLDWNVKNMLICAFAGSILSYSITLNDLQAGSMLVGSVTGILALYAHTLQKEIR